MRAKFSFVGGRVGSGSSMTADQAAFNGVFDALEGKYGRGIFSERNRNSVDVALQDEKENQSILTISTDLPVEKIGDFNQAVIRELHYAGFAMTSDPNNGKKLSFFQRLFRR